MNPDSDADRKRLGYEAMCVEPLTDRGPSCVLWTGTFFCYGVEVFHTPMARQLVPGGDGPESWTVGSSGPWAASSARR